MRNIDYFWLYVLLHLSAILLAAVLYLLYQNRMAEDMIRELSRDCEELLRGRETDRDGEISGKNISRVGG